MIRNYNGKYVLYSKSSGRRLGVYTSREKAVARERQIQFFKMNKVVVKK